MDSQTLTVMLVITVEEESRELFLKTLETYLPVMRQEEGCLQSFMYEDSKERNHFFIIEMWKNQSLWNKHLQAQSVAKISSLAGSTMKMKLHKLSMCNI